MRSTQDTLKEYMERGETQNAARFLKFLNENDQKMERRVPSKKSGGKRSGHWQITRSVALDALLKGEAQSGDQLSIHFEMAFRRSEGESLEDHQKRAMETFDAFTDAAKGMLAPEERDFFSGVDGAASYAIQIIGEFDRFPTKREVRNWTCENTKFRSKTDADWTKIYRFSHLSFLPRG